MLPGLTILSAPGGFVGIIGLPTDLMVVLEVRSASETGSCLLLNAPHYKHVLFFVLGQVGGRV